MADKEVDEQTIEVSQLCCGNCQGTTWNLSSFTNEDGQTFLIVTCADETCTSKQLETTQDKDKFQVVWKIFDITGQLDNDLHLPYFEPSDDREDGESGGLLN